MGLFSGILKGVTKAVGSITGGDILGAGLSFLGGERANDASADQSAAQMAFQERMRATQYQTTMDDMKKAGLNPILAYKTGGAGTPAGAAADMSDTISPAVSTAMQSMRMRADLKNLVEQNAKIQSDTALNKALKTKAIADSNLSNATARNVKSQNALIEAQHPGAQNEAEYQRSVGAAAPWAKGVLNFLHDMFGAANSAKSLSK